VAYELERSTRLLLDSYRNSRWHVCRNLIGPGYRYEETGVGRCVDGVEDVRTGWQRWVAAVPDTQVEIEVVRGVDLTVAG
jgi:hypothetical protein